jgi:hypothetical protein
MVDWKRPKAQRGSTESITVAPMQALVLLQRADGSWDLTQNFAAAIGQPLSVLEAAVNGTASSRVEIRRTWATALAIAWLQEHASDVEDEWRMLSAKARRWLEGVRVPAGGGGEWTERAAKFLRGLSAPVTSPGD